VQWSEAGVDNETFMRIVEEHLARRHVSGSTQARRASWRHNSVFGASDPDRDHRAGRAARLDEVIGRVTERQQANPLTA